MLLWLVLAVISPAPKPVKNLSYPLNAEWQQIRICSTKN